MQAAAMMKSWQDLLKFAEQMFPHKQSSPVSQRCMAHSAVVPIDNVDLITYIYIVNYCDVRHGFSLFFLDRLIRFFSDHWH